MTNAFDTRPAAPVAAAETKPATTQLATPAQDITPPVVDPITVPVEASAKAV